jgi:hypothetical protein
LPALSATVALERHKDADALRSARLAVAAADRLERAQPYARALLARASAANGDARAAEEEARRALEANERLGLPFVTSLACAVAVR